MRHLANDTFILRLFLTNPCNMRGASFGEKEVRVTFRAWLLSYPYTVSIGLKHIYEREALKTSSSILLCVVIGK